MTSGNVMTAAVTTLHEAITNGIFKVPVNQRPWAWQLQEVKQFLADFDATLAQQHAMRADGTLRPKTLEPPPYFLGSFVVFQEIATSAKSVPVVEVVDGQQRMTTLSVLARSLKGAADSLYGTATGSNRSRAATAAAILGPWLEAPGGTERLTLDPDYESFFRSYAMGPSVDLRKAALLAVKPTTMDDFRRDSPVLYGMKRAVDAVDKYVDSHLAGETDLQKSWWLTAAGHVLNKRIQCLYVVVSDYAYGLELFRGLNATGRPLASPDNIKNELFRNATRADATGIRSDWFAMVRALPGRDVESFLRYRQLAQYGPTTRSQLYARVAAREILVRPARKLIRDWRTDAEALDKLHRPEMFHWRPLTGQLLANIRLMDAQLTWILLFAARARFITAGSDSPIQFERCVRLARDFAFRTSTAAPRRDTAVLEKGMVEGAALLREGKHADSVRDHLRGLSSDRQFAEYFATYRETRPAVRYHVLYELEKQASNGTTDMPAGPGGDVDIEHVLPESFEASQPGDWSNWRSPSGEPNSDHSDYINRIGNVLPLECALNSKLNSGAFPAKANGTWPPGLALLAGKARPSYASSRLTLPNLLRRRRYQKWTPTTIDTWQKALAEIAVKVWALDS